MTLIKKLGKLSVIKEITHLYGGSFVNHPKVSTFTGKKIKITSNPPITLEADGELLILVQYKAEVEKPENEDLVTVGILATVRDLIRTPHVGVQMLVELHRRVAFEGLTHKEPHLRGTFVELEETFTCVLCCFSQKAGSQT